MTNQAYVVKQMTFDASRPFAVVATFRRFNQVIARYADKSQAARRASDLSKCHK